MGMASTQVQDAGPALGQQALGRMGQGGPPLTIKGKKSQLCLQALADRMPEAALLVISLSDRVQADAGQMQPLGQQRRLGALPGTDWPNEDDVRDRSLIGSNTRYHLLPTVTPAGTAVDGRLSSWLDGSRSDSFPYGAASPPSC
jgi:hypothetical protein